MAKKIISLTISEELIRELDNKRGLIPRSTFVEELLKKSLKKRWIF